MSFDPSKDLKTEVDELGLAKRVTCLTCNVVITDIPTGASEGKRMAEMKGLGAHLELAHDMVTFYERCGDPACGRLHFSAFHKGKVPPEFLGLRSRG